LREKIDERKGLALTRRLLLLQKTPRLKKTMKQLGMMNQSQQTRRWIKNFIKNLMQNTSKVLTSKRLS